MIFCIAISVFQYWHIARVSSSRVPIFSLSRTCLTLSRFYYLRFPFSYSPCPEFTTFLSRIYYILVPVLSDLVPLRSCPGFYYIRTSTSLGLRGSPRQGLWGSRHCDVRTFWVQTVQSKHCDSTCILCNLCQDSVFFTRSWLLEKWLIKVSLFLTH